MDKPTTKNDEDNPNQGIAKPAVPADVGELAANESIHKDGPPQTVKQAAKEPHIPWIGRRVLNTLLMLWESLKSPEVSNRTIAIATVVIAAATVFTWLEVRSGSTQTDKIIDADQRIATAMEGAVGQAAASLAETQKSFRDDQRAWIGPVAGPIIDWGVGKKFSVAIPVKNDGKTPATDVTTVMAIRPLSRQKLPIFTDLVKPSGHFVLQPGGVTYIKIIGGRPINQADFDAVNSGDIILWVYGKITYDDVFGRHHWTTFAQTFNPSNMGLDMYSTDNQVDQQIPN